MKTNLKIIATAVLVWVLRVAVILPFLNEEGGFTLEAGKGLPLIVDYFFSTLFFVMIVLMFLVTYYFLPKSRIQSYAKTGLNITLLFFATFIVVDLIVEIGVFKRTFLGYIESVFIDYSPLLIPYFTGLIVQKTQSKNQKSMKPVYEIAINQAKDGNVENFLNTRAKFVEVLGKEENTLNEGKWKPFFTVDPSLKLDEILVGMTHWNSMQGFGETAMKLLPQQVSKDYFASFNPLAYGLLETVDGKPFDMETIKQEGNVIEFAIRKGKTDDAFGQKRETFFKSLENYDGYKFAREFKFYELDAQGMPKLAENTQAVIIVWDNSEKFQAAATPIFGSKEYADFANLIEVKSYFATFSTK